MFGFSYESASRLADFLRNRVTFNFDTVVDMRSSIYVQEGMVVRTGGYYSVGDGGACTYTIRLRTSSDSDDGATKIFCGRQRRDSNYSQPFVAEPRIDATYLDIRQFGLTSFIHSSIQMADMSKCLTYCLNNGLYLCVHNKDFYDLAKTVQSGTVSLAGVKVQLKGMDMNTIQTMPVFHWDFVEGSALAIQSSVDSSYTNMVRGLDLHTTNSGSTSFSSLESSSASIVPSSTDGVLISSGNGLTRCVDAVSNKKFIVSAKTSGTASFIVYCFNSSKALIQADYNQVSIVDNGVFSYMSPCLVEEGTSSESLGYCYKGSTWTGYRTASIEVLDTNVKYLAIGVCGESSTTKMVSLSISEVYTIDYEGGVTNSSYGVSRSFKMQPEVEETTEPGSGDILRTNGSVGEVVRFVPSGIGSLTGSGTVNIGWMKKTKTSSGDTWIVLKQDYQA